jgi:DNA-binding NarL/FixJ family response regulator
MTGATASTQRSGVGVLVADSDGDSRAEIVSLLDRLGCDSREASTGEEALAAVQHRRPALVVIDVGVDGTSGYEVCRELRERYGEALPIMFVSSLRVEPSDEVAGLLLGADDYLAKPMCSDRFLARARRLLARSTVQPEATMLTPRERQVLTLLVNGMRTKEIAGELCITLKTVSTHIEHIMSKLGAHSQAQAVAFAVRDHLVNTAA